MNYRFRDIFKLPIPEYDLVKNSDEEAIYRLYAAVLISAIQDYQKGNICEKRLAEQWLNGVGGDITYQEVIDVLDIDDADVRRVMQKKYRVLRRRTNYDRKKNSYLLTI
jgi:hypothetical protein